MSVLLIGTLDTKGTEFAHVRDQLRSGGVAVTVVDAGVLGPPAFAPDIPREAVFAAAGTTIRRRQVRRGIAARPSRWRPRESRRSPPTCTARGNSRAS